MLVNISTLGFWSTKFGAPTYSHYLGIALAWVLSGPLKVSDASIHGIGCRSAFECKAMLDVGRI